jgi:hypothetical protein
MRSQYQAPDSNYASLQSLFGTICIHYLHTTRPPLPKNFKPEIGGHILVDPPMTVTNETASESAALSIGEGREEASLSLTLKMLS